MFSFSDGLKKKKLNSLSYAVFHTIRDKYIEGQKKSAEQRSNKNDSQDAVLLLNELDISMTGQEITGIVLEQLNNDKAIKAGRNADPKCSKKKKGDKTEDIEEFEEDRYKNIQRRVYDTINVLIALDIVHKNKNRLWYNIKNQLFFENDTSLRMTKLSNAKIKT